MLSDAATQVPRACIRAYLDGDDVDASCEVAVLSYGLLVLSDHHHVDQACQVVVVPDCCGVHTPAQTGSALNAQADRQEVLLNVV